MNNEKSNRPELFIDNEKFGWDKDTITGAELRELGSLPADVEIYWKAPGNPDLPIENDTTVDLREHPGPERFSTQPVGSQAGA